MTKKINGFTVIAHRPYGNTVPAEGFTILGAKATATGYEYVTAVVETLDDKEWSWGRYFNTFDGPDAIGRALTDYRLRN